MMKHLVKHQLLLGAFLGLTLVNVLTPTQTAEAYRPDRRIYQTKGYSKELITTAISQQDRQEWRPQTQKKRGPVAQFLHNVVYNEWTGGFDEFGDYRIRSLP